MCLFLIWAGFGLMLISKATYCTSAQVLKWFFHHKLEFRYRRCCFGLRMHVRHLVSCFLKIWLIVRDISIKNMSTSFNWSLSLKTAAGNFLQSLKDTFLEGLSSSPNLYVQNTVIKQKVSHCRNSLHFFAL